MNRHASNLWSASGVAAAATAVCIPAQTPDANQKAVVVIDSVNVRFIQSSTAGNATISVIGPTAAVPLAELSTYLTASQNDSGFLNFSKGLPVVEMTVDANTNYNSNFANHTTISATAFSVVTSLPTGCTADIMVAYHWDNPAVLRTV